jgi:hypothetical protein
VAGDAYVVALLTTLPLFDLLAERFDDDWFRNPRAWQFLRIRAAGGDGADDTGEPDPVALARAFEKALG